MWQSHLENLFHFRDCCYKSFIDQRFCLHQSIPRSMFYRCLTQYHLSILRSVFYRCLTHTRSVLRSVFYRYLTHTTFHTTFSVLQISYPYYVPYYVPCFKDVLPIPRSILRSVFYRCFTEHHEQIDLELEFRSLWRVEKVFST